MLLPLKVFERKNEKVQLGLCTKINQSVEIPQDERLGDHLNYLHEK